MSEMIIDIDGILANDKPLPDEAFCRITLNGVTFSTYVNHRLALQIETPAPVEAIYLTPGTYALMTARQVELKVENWGYRENRGDYRIWWRYTWDEPSKSYYPVIELLPQHPVSMDKH